MSNNNNNSRSGNTTSQLIDRLIETLAASVVTNRRALRDITNTIENRHCIITPSTAYENPVDENGNLVVLNIAIETETRVEYEINGNELARYHYSQDRRV